MNCSDFLRPCVDIHKSQYKRVWANCNHINCSYYIFAIHHISLSRLRTLMQYIHLARVYYLTYMVFIYYDLVALNYARGFIT